MLYKAAYGRLATRAETDKQILTTAETTLFIKPIDFC